MSHADQFKPFGLLQKYRVTRADGSPTDDGADYFVLRLDDGGKDPIHVAACRKAVLCYADAIAHHLPLLAQELRAKYKPAPVEPDDKGRKSTEPCAKCGAFDVWVQEINDYPDYRITCHTCQHSYCVDGPDA